MSKAFDKVNHYALYCKLMDRNIQPRFLKLLINWYGKCFCAVRWNNVCSSFFKLSCGFRQGGVLSPLFFVIYVDGILCRLVNSKLGCSLGNIRLGYIMYADDLILMASSLTMIQ